ncbi:Ig-like domain-containing protein [Carboxylicivirga sp. N1Y90]|uniref:Ig-like domain-containing protein n=1 Tax=Carboxylicivirga fragile TaxID=3417571 RepID=UPI003D3300B3|nr:Ig-like domain-containing protein [Marinilabiliaceae bacterium N1Y90]
MKNKLYQIGVFVGIFLMMYSCANVGMPTGGEKDELPPVVVKSTPRANALNYQKNEVSIEFDELIKLNNVREKFVVSPPMNEAPTVEARGNRLEVIFNEDLQPNATYTLDFADAIEDNNESNVLESYSFSFSTGEFIDSLQISGNVWEAMDLAPSEGVFVLLHENLNDTAVQTLVPIRLAKTNSVGQFTLKNIRPGQYRLYALDDANRNYKFDQPGEIMGWSDIVVEPSYEYREFVDTIHIDSLETDSLHYRTELVYIPDSVELFVFQHDYKNQYLLSEERKEAAKLTYFFNRPLEEDAKISFTGQDELEDVFMVERSLNNDTVTYWLTDSTIYKQDSLSINLSYIMRDSMDVAFEKIDTIAMYHFKVGEDEKKKKKKKKKDDEPEPIKLLKLKDVKSKIDVFGTFNFYLESPAISFDKNAIQFFKYNDTIPEPIDLELVQDTMRIRHYSVDHRWEPGAKYEMQIDSASIVDIYGLHNGPVNATFTIKSLEDYSTVYVDVIEPADNWLLQVVNKNELVVQQLEIPKSGKLGFRYLNPGDYMLRIVVDENRNGQWDSGNYYEGIQPESIIYYHDKISLRANWQQEIPGWNPHKFSVDQFSRQYRKPKKKE